MAALADLGERFTILAIVPTSYGSTAALVNQADLVLPILDREANPPAPIAAAYAEVAPWFEECHCPIDPAGLTLGRQLFWLSRAFPDEFGRTRWILPFAQYWAWGLTGVPACEVTSLGAQTQLWSPSRRDFSSLVRRERWAEKLPPLRSAWEVLGPLQYEVAQKCKLPVDTPVLCGIHEGGARLARYLAAGLRDFTLISTGAQSDRVATGTAAGSSGSAARNRRGQRSARPPRGLRAVHGWPGVCRDRRRRCRGCWCGHGRRRGADRCRNHGIAVIHAERRSVPGHGRQGQDRRPAA